MGMWIGRNRKARVTYGFDEIALVPGRITINPNEVDIAWRLPRRDAEPLEFKIPILWLSGPQDSHSAPASFDEEKAFAREILMKWPTNIPIFGWPDNGQWVERGIGEWQGVKLFSECGKFEVCSAYDGYSPTVNNLSVHSGTTATLRQAPPASVKVPAPREVFWPTERVAPGMTVVPPV